MKEYWNELKRRIKWVWYRGKRWAMATLIALGLITGSAMAGTKTFTWTNPTLNEDGSAYNAATEQLESRIYCGVDPAAFIPQKPADDVSGPVSSSHSPLITVPGDLQATSRDFIVGDYSCFATVVSVYGYESMPSNVTTFTVTPQVRPSAIDDFSIAGQ